MGENLRFKYRNKLVHSWLWSGKCPPLLKNVVCVCSHPSSPKHIAFQHSPAYELSVTVLFDCHFLGSCGMYFNWIECIHPLLSVRLIGTNTHTHYPNIDRQYFHVCGRCFFLPKQLSESRLLITVTLLWFFLCECWLHFTVFHPMMCVCVCMNECVLSRPSGFHCGFKGMSPLSPHTAMLYKV